MMTWLVVLIVLVGLVLVWLAFGRLFATDTDETTQRAIIGLRAIHCRLKADQFRSELRRDSTQVRHELRDTLNNHRDEPSGKD